ncbi:hypothetical protein [Amaricoccus macauensis]|uniref:hypothetical protein n=1 Tax=Amaricoccus macauensis TaxID=57001 RepID=UPI003C798D2A
MPHVTSFAIAAALFGLSATPASASYWEKGHWRVQTTDTGSCEVRTGGDGNGSLSLHVDPKGFNATLVYEPVYFRGEALPLRDTDEISLIFDGEESWLSSEVFVSEGTSDWGEPSVEAIMTTGFIGDAVAELRASNTLIVARMREGEARVFDTYLLDGFTANWLKAAEWCDFDPRALPSS